MTAGQKGEAFTVLDPVAVYSPDSGHLLKIFLCC